jgi:hypothetical protein
VGFTSDRGVYSILGAAAMTASVTRTVSVAMIVLELNGHLSHAVPCMVCVLCSYAVSEFLKPESFFEMLSTLSGLDRKATEKGRILIKDLLEINPEYQRFEFISLADSSRSDLVKIVRKHSRKTNTQSTIEVEGHKERKLNYVPVVDSKQKMNLLFMVSLKELEEVLDDT